MSVWFIFQFLRQSWPRINNPSASLVPELKVSVTMPASIATFVHITSCSWNARGVCVECEFTTGTLWCSQLTGSHISHFLAQCSCLRKLAVGNFKLVLFCKALYQLLLFSEPLSECSFTNMDGCNKPVKYLESKSRFPGTVLPRTTGFRFVKLCIQGANLFKHIYAITHNYSLIPIRALFLDHPRIIN